MTMKKIAFDVRETIVEQNSFTRNLRHYILLKYYDLAMDKISVTGNIKHMTRKRYLLTIVLLNITVFVMCTHISLRNSKDKINKEIQTAEKSYKILDNIDRTSQASLKTILIWTRPNHDPLMFLLRNQKAFINRKCKVKSCYITTDKAYLRNISEFDVVIFNGPDIVNKKKPKLPLSRSTRQKYVYASIESSDYYPICDNRFDGYFNVSWTYKLNSDIFYGYVIIRNRQGEVIGPQKDMHWMSVDEMLPINDTVRQKLSSKKKLAAWLVSNCRAPSGRDQFVKAVQRELNILHTDMEVDVYGKCGTISCEKDTKPDCLEIFERDYHFYFSFENSFAEDYVTEKLLHPLQHFMLPVVYGTANYTRFMPDGTYLNARELGPANLAKKMVELVNDKEKYYSYFKWINHYSFHYVEEVPETDFYCKFCEAMNDESFMNTSTVIKNFKEWWNPPKIRRGACPPRYP